MQQIKNFFKKGNYTKIKIAIAIILAISLAVVYTITRKTFVIDRIFLVSFIILFIELHFILKLDVMYNWIYKNRFYIAGIAFLTAVIFEYSGSSIGMYNDVLQPESRSKYFEPVLGKYRSIRSDEWFVNTPIFVSQAVDNNNRFAYYNDNLRGTTTDMFSVVAPAVADIMTIARPFNVGFLILGASRGLAFLWAGKWIGLMLVAFEFFMLLTDKKKVISLCGMALTVFSAATEWWNMTDVLLWGMLALILVDKYLKTDKLKVKILCAIGIFISAISYVFIMYPAWQLPFLYIYIALFISLCIKNRKNYRLQKKDIPIIFLVVLAIIGIGIRYLYMSKDALQATMNSAYPGKRFEIGGDGLRVLFSYIYSFLFPYSKIGNPCEVSGMTSFYPIPMILALIYLVKNKDRKEHFPFLIPLLILSVIFSIFALTKTNSIFAKITLLYMSPGRRVAVPLGFIQIIILVYLMGITKKETNIMKDDVAKILSIILSVILVSIAIKTAPTDLWGSLKIYCCGLILLTFLYLILTMNNEKNKKILIVGLIGISIITGATVNPIQKGISVLTDKPLAKEVKKIVDEDKENNLWCMDGTIFYMNNYILASGAKVVNSTNIYPNFQLFEKVLSNEDFNNEAIRFRFNRYAHITLEITENENKVDLLYEDSIKLRITPENIKKLGIKYVVSTRDIEKFNKQDVNFEQIYSELGISIYKVR